VSADSAQRIQAIEQSLCILTCQPDIKSDVSDWLKESELSNSWQSTTDLTEVRQVLLNHTYSNVLLDMRTSPHKMLTHIRYLKEHFVHCTLVALVDRNSSHWGKTALQNGVNAYVCKEDISGVGLTMILDSFQHRQNHPTLPTINSSLFTDRINEPLFFDRLNHALKIAVRHNTHTGILLVSLDDYDALIENNSELVRDEILNQVSKILKTTIRSSDSLARINDDLFAILLEDLNDEVMIAHIADNIQRNLKKIFDSQSTTHNLTVSIGGHLCSPGELNGLVLYQQTHSALERAIGSGKQGMWFYIQDMNFKVMARLHMLKGLERAVNNNEFYLQYHPNHTGKGFIPNGVVPIIHWKHPTAGIVMPEIFMELLISSGLIIKAGIWMIEQACSQLKEWNEQGNWGSQFKVFIPISEKQLRHESLIYTLMQQLSINTLESEQIILKFDDQTAINNTDAINSLIKHIPNIGIAIDLCTESIGFNSFSHLKKMRVNYICLAPDFFQRIHLDHSETSITTVVINLAHSLGIEVLASGADSQHKVDKMQALGCDSIQGKFFSQPVYAEQWASYLMSR
jgi:diguanylate cyclase (GGDEF)-like protein